MAKLIISVDGQVLDEVELAKERTSIGRKPHNDVRIENLAVSGEHAVIVTILNDSFLEDLGSTNGTTVNGNPVKKHFLQHNDVVEIGKYKLKYINEKASQAPSSDFEKTMVLRPAARPGGPTSTTVSSGADATITRAGPMPMADPASVIRAATQVAAGVESASVEAAMAPAAAAPAAAAPAAPPPPPAQTIAPTTLPPSQPPAAIQILTGPGAGKELDLVKNLTTLGKPGVQVAVITKRPHGFFITHVEGAQFPRVNGVPLDAQPRQLNDHDIIELAGVKMEFFLKPA